MQLFDIMCERTRSSPTRHMHKFLFYILCKRRWIVEAETLFREMQSQGFFVDKVMYTSLINGYCKDKKMKMTMQVYSSMLKTGCELDTYTCNTTVHGFTNVGLFDKTCVLYNQMIDQGMQPNVVTHHIMINNYCKERKVDCTLMLLNNMVMHNLTSIVHCYIVLIVALYKENRLVEVGEVYTSMLNQGVVPDHVLFFVFLKMHPRECKLQLALMILKAIAENCHNHSHDYESQLKFTSSWIYLQKDNENNMIGNNPQI